MNISDDLRKKFHAHLDKCSRCRNQPFNLCPEGQVLLEQAAGAVHTFNRDLIAASKELRR